MVNLRTTFSLLALAVLFVPTLAFADCGDENGPDTALNATVSPAGVGANGALLFGSGNPPTGFLQQEADRTPLELDLSVIHRTGNTIQPSGVTSCGEIIYTVPAGPQVVDPANNVSAGNPTRAAWNFNYAALLGASAGTLQQFLASGNRLEIKIDLDPGPGVRNLTLHAVLDPAHNPAGSHIVWETAQGAILFGDDGGTTQATENSENDDFWAALIGSDPKHPGYDFGPAVFNIELTAETRNGHELADIRTIINVVAAPAATASN